MKLRVFYEKKLKIDKVYKVFFLKKLTVCLDDFFIFSPSIYIECQVSL